MGVYYSWVHLDRREFIQCGDFDDSRCKLYQTIWYALDTMVKWFCILFGNQFTPDEVYDNYPADRLMHDIALALMAVQTQTTEVLDTFPTIPVVQEAERILGMDPQELVKTEP